MINKNFKQDWEHYGGEINVIDAKHFELSIDKDYFGFTLEFSISFRMVYIKIFNITIRIF